MNRLTPIEQFKREYTGNLCEILCDQPCAIVSWFTAIFSFKKTYPILGYNKKVSGVNYPCDDKGYCTLYSQNRCIRELFKVKKYTYFKREERKKLKDLNINGINIICVSGHYISTCDNEYYSFFDNDNDDVIAIWELKDAL